MRKCIKCGKNVSEKQIKKEYEEDLKNGDIECISKYYITFNRKTIVRIATSIYCESCKIALDN